MDPVKFKKRLENNFFSKVEKTDTCWLWLGLLDKDGYGLTSMKSRAERAHRLSWILANGDIPKGMCVCHHCDNPKCVRPDHLFLGTAADNVKDKIKKSRQAKGDKIWTRRNPELCKRGDDHYSRRHPELLARGLQNGSYTMPEMRRRGETHGNAILTESKIIEIRNLYSSKKANQYKLAAMYGVSQTTISAIVRRVAWSHL